VLKEELEDVMSAPVIGYKLLTSTYRKKKAKLEQQANVQVEMVNLKTKVWRPA